MNRQVYIIETGTEPNISTLWLDKGVLKHYHNGKWKPLFENRDAEDMNLLMLEVSADDFTAILNEQMKVYKVEEGIYNAVVLKVDGYQYYLSKDITADSTISYSLKSQLVGDSISVIQGVLSGTSLSLVSKYIDISKEILELEIGDAEEVKEHNLGMIRDKDLFFTQLDYGFGVGNYLGSDVGGSVHVITTDGVLVKYSITGDGAIEKTSEKDLDNIIGVPEGGTDGQVLKKTASGHAWAADNNTTYTKATASADGLMAKEDKVKLEGLSNYTLPAATKTAIGGVKAGTNIASLAADAELPTVIGTVNSILTQLKATGILIS